MKILMINVVCGIRSTGRICTDLATALEAQGHEVKIAYGRGEVPEEFQKYAIRIGSNIDVKIHGLRARLADECGWGSKKATVCFIEWVKKYNPDVIHLHNIHGYYINIEVLFNYLRICGKKIIWTLHDCWAFTGHAAYCEASNCERWETGCFECPKVKDYPSSLLDRSKINWNRKKILMTDIPKMVIVTPSKWLEDLVNRSFLGCYRIITINNGIDIDVFHKVKDPEKLIDIFRNNSELKNKRIILGVAAIWNKRKGLADFYLLNEKIDHGAYCILLVGLSKEQIGTLPKGIIGLENINSVNELAAVYSASYVFVNPTYEDNYPTTNLEAIACGTPVITYNTGGSAEMAEKNCVVSKGDINKIYDLICSGNLMVNKTVKIDKREMLFRYLELYMNI